jgi:hypothetical protein
VTTREDSKFSRRGAEERTYRRAKSRSQQATDSALGSPVALCLISRFLRLSPVPQCSSESHRQAMLGGEGLAASQAGRELA